MSHLHYYSLLWSSSAASHSVSAKASCNPNLSIQLQGQQEYINRVSGATLCLVWLIPRASHHRYNFDGLNNIGKVTACERTQINDTVNCFPKANTLIKFNYSLEIPTSHEFHLGLTIVPIMVNHLDGKSIHNAKPWQAHQSQQELKMSRNFFQTIPYQADNKSLSAFLNCWSVLRVTKESVIMNCKINNLNCILNCRKGI